MCELLVNMVVVILKMRITLIFSMLQILKVLLINSISKNPYTCIVDLVHEVEKLQKN
ncbi:UNVERIFIED_CONTAM: hypothetical protein GTU68_015081 [Idotea baltica]|nr:hypothetical protein [Idotea baltica]